MRKHELVIATTLLLATSVAGAQVINFQFLVTLKGGHKNPAQVKRCYLVGWHTDVGLWKGVCDIVDSATITGGFAHHKEIIWWDNNAKEKKSKPCGEDCPAKVAGNLTVLYNSSGTGHDYYVVGRAPNGTIGAHNSGGAEEILLLYTNPNQYCDPCRQENAK